MIPRPSKIVSGTLWAVSGNNSVGEIRVQFEIIGSLSNHDDERRTTTGSKMNITAQARTKNSVVV